MRRSTFQSTEALAHALSPLVGKGAASRIWSGRASPFRLTALPLRRMQSSTFVVI
jgi:hypothetical protein